MDIVTAIVICYVAAVVCTAAVAIAKIAAKTFN